MKTKQKTNSITNIENNFITKSFPALKVKPKLKKLFSDVFSTNFEEIINYLPIAEVTSLRKTNKSFYSQINSYFPKRLRLEVDRINQYQMDNYSTFLSFMKMINSQIPISKGNWLDFDLNSVVEKLKLINKNMISSLKSIKNLGKISETVFAPFCILLGCNKVKTNQWKKLFFKIINENDFFRKVQKIDLDNLSEPDVLDAFVYLNSDELMTMNLKYFSDDLYKLIVWCQAIVSYHILIHPYTYRNSTVPLVNGSEMQVFLTRMNRMISKFYKFKRFLMEIGNVEIPLGEFVFNLQHSRADLNTNHYQPFELLSSKEIGNILSYIEYESSFRLIEVSKVFRIGFKESVDITIIEILKEIFYIKQQIDERHSEKYGFLSEISIFSEAFFMIEEIIMSVDSIFNKDILNDIKNLKIDNPLSNLIIKTLLSIIGERPEKIILPTGELKNKYLEKVKSLVISGKFMKKLKEMNKFEHQTDRLLLIVSEIEPLLEYDKIIDIKKINRGLSQMIVYTLYYLVYNKFLNPYAFISEVNDENENENSTGLFQYYSNLIGYLKHNFHIRHRFSGCLNLRFFIKETLGRLQESSSSIPSQNQSVFYKIHKIYNESKDVVPPNAKHVFYERIILEILKASKVIISSKSGTNLFLNQSRGSEINNQNLNNMNNVNIDKYDEESDISQVNKVNKHILNSTALDIIKEEENLNEVQPNQNLKSKQLIHNNTNTYNKNKNIYNNIDQNPVTQVEKGKDNRIYIVSKIPKSNETILESIPNELFVKHILFFLDIFSLPKFASVSKRCNECVKIHYFLRVFFLNKEKQAIESENEDLINGIFQKRIDYLNEYEIPKPSKENAMKMFKQITFQVSFIYYIKTIYY